MLFGRRQRIESVPASDEVELEVKHREIAKEFSSLLHRRRGSLAFVPPSYEVGLEGIHREYESDVRRMEFSLRAIGCVGVSTALLATGAIIGGHYFAPRAKSNHNSPSEVAREQR